MIRNYQIIEKIGKGTFGIVYKVKKYNDPLIYVIKQISLNGLADYQINQVYAEAKILSLIKSKYVVKYYESFLEDDNLNIVMEYCDNGDLCNYLNEQKKKSIPLKEDLIWKIFIKITLGLATIHKMKILHRDLKTLNIFLKKDMEIKIGDLGVAKELNQASFANTIIGTPYYLSPEMCEDKPYNQKSDVWALGVILYELCTFRHPFNAGNHAALILKIMTANPEPILACYSNNLQKIVNCILEKKIEKRPNCWDLLNMKIISEKAKMLGLYNEIVNICFDEYYFNENNNNINSKNNQIGNFIRMDSEDILLQSNLIPLDQKNTKIHVKKINDEIKRIPNENLNNNKNYVFNGKTNEREFQNNYINNINPNVNVYKDGNQKNIIQNNNINNFNNINQIPYNYNNNQNNINYTNYNNIDFSKGNYIMLNNNYNNLFNNNLNQNNNIIYNNILINNNTINTNDPSIINNINNRPNFVKVTRVYKQPKIENEEYFFEDKNINDINDSLNISVQVAPIDMDRFSDKIQSSINDFSNQKDLENNYYNYSSKTYANNESIYDYGEDCTKDNTRNQNNKLNLEIKKDESETSDQKRIKNNNSGNKKNEHEEEGENFNNLQKISIKRSNSLIEKDISPIQLITNTQESINIMENIKNLNLDEEGYNSNKKSKNGSESKKKELNIPNMSNKKKGKIRDDKFDDIEDINNKKFNKTIDNLSSSDVLNMNIEHQDTIPIKNYLTSNNLKYNSRDSDLDSDSDFNILKSSENDINNSDNKKIIEQKIPTIDIEEKENDNNYSIDEEEDIISLEAKIKNIKKEIFILIGEKYYSYINNLYNQINNKENLFKEIEQFIENNNFTKIKKEKLLDLFLTLITTEAKIRDKKYEI